MGLSLLTLVCRFRVALLAEGVDRNSILVSSRRLWMSVALLAEGVDRNSTKKSMHRATRQVALLAEGVDRNHHLRQLSDPFPESPSSRRAWIEILCLLTLTEEVFVALLAEGVDRNQKPLDKIEKVWCRPPRGGRG